MGSPEPGPSPAPTASPEVRQGSSRAEEPSSLTPPLVRRGPAELLAVLSGLLYFCAFPGVEVWPLAFLALVPLLVALRGQSPARAAWLGWLSGMTMTSTGFYWMLEMLRVFSGMPTIVCVLLMVLLSAYQSGRMALFGWVAARIERHRWPPGLALGLGFVVSELAFPLLFPWYYAATVHGVPALVQSAELGGPILVGSCLLAANLALASLVTARLERRAPPWRAALAGVAVFTSNLAYGAFRIPQVDAAAAAAPRARVGLVQANMSLRGKRRNQAEGLRRHVALTRSLTGRVPLDFVVWSESSVMSVAAEQDAAALYRRAFAAELGVPAIFGGVLLRRVPDQRGYVLFNSALATAADGTLQGRYDKQFLLAFGEYLPWGDRLPILYEWSPNSGRFTPGTRNEPLPIAGHEAAVFICYEDLAPSFVNGLMQSGRPELLVNLTNDAWFGDTTEPWIHHALAKLRAIEQRRYFVRSTNSGVSAVVDPVGRVVAQTKTFEVATLHAEIAWMTGATPYQRWGDAPWWLASALALAGCFLRRPERLRAPSPS